MKDWIFDRRGNATLILDSDCIRSSYGQVIAWVSRNNVYTLQGSHYGWFEDGVLADSFNQVLGFIRNSTGHLPSRPGFSGTPIGTHGFACRPGRPAFSGTPTRPGRDGWSSQDLASYFIRNKDTTVS
jgi:hypothetical protein